MTAAGDGSRAFNFINARRFRDIFFVCTELKLEKYIRSVALNDLRPVLPLSDCSMSTHNHKTVDCSYQSASRSASRGYDYFKLRIHRNNLTVNKVPSRGQLRDTDRYTDAVRAQ